MAKNTGRGSRYAANSPDSKRFQKAKAQGGNFTGRVVPPFPDLTDELVELDSLSGSPRTHPIRDFLSRVGRAIRGLGR